MVGYTQADVNAATKPPRHPVRLRCVSNGPLRWEDLRFNPIILT